MWMVAGREYELKREIYLLNYWNEIILAWSCAGRSDPIEREWLLLKQWARFKWEDMRYNASVNALVLEVDSKPILINWSMGKNGKGGGRLLMDFFSYDFFLFSK